MNYYITTETRQQVRKMLTMKGDDAKLSFDFSPWAEDNAALTSVTWTVESGQASIDGQALSSSVATARITTNETGTSLIKLSATDGTHTKTVHLKVLTKDPEYTTAASDYGLVTL